MLLACCTPSYNNTFDLHEPLGVSTTLMFSALGLGSRGRTGYSWLQNTSNAGFGARIDGALIAFQDRLYMIGGVDSGRNPRGDVWVSADGTTWELAAAPFPTNVRYQSPTRAAVYQGELWVLLDTVESGSRSFQYYASPDGIHWSLRISSSFFNADPNQPAALMLEYGGSLWTFIGEDTERASLSTSTSNRFYKFSYDGGSFAYQFDDLVLADNMLYYAAFSTGERVIISGSGGAWHFNGSVLSNFFIGNEAEDNATGFLPLHVLFLRDRFYMLGPDGVRESVDGRTWAAGRGPFNILCCLIEGPRADFGAAVFLDRLWIAGGTADGAASTQVWHSP